MLLVALRAYKKSKPIANNSIVKRLNVKKKTRQLTEQISRLEFFMIFCQSKATTYFIALMTELCTIFFVLSPIVLTASATKATIYILAGSVVNLPIFSGSL